MQVSNDKQKAKSKLEQKKSSIAWLTNIYIYIDIYHTHITL